MKVRTGFVSNSSTSSFVVAFHKVPETVEELHEMLFVEKKWNIHQSKIVFDDMQGQKPATLLQIARECRDGCWGRSCEIDKIYNDESLSWEEKHLRADKIYRRTAIDYLRSFLKICLEGSKFFIFEYDDHAGGLENAGMFDRLPHIQISHH